MKGLVFLFCLFASSWALVNPNIVQPTGFTKLRTSGQSTLYTIELPSSAHGYQYPPYLLDLQGSRHQIGYDYAALLHDETVTLFTGFIQSLFPSAQDQYLINMFLDYCWDRYVIRIRWFWVICVSVSLRLCSGAFCVFVLIFPSAFL